MSVSGSLETESSAIVFGEKFARSSQFDAIFREGMQLVEKTAEYLDGAGREQAKGLRPPVSVVYATESMRLTTRLLDLATWLLVQRSLKDGDITEEEALAKRENVKLRPFGRPTHIKCFEDLPDGLQDLIIASFSLSDRITQLDLAMRANEEDVIAAARNPVNEHLRKLEDAFAVSK
ncbi:MAG: DUF1465 family protein [Hyphomicrobiaceae bacterium TMED74]|nr:hypothetical protein [Filomicrobium sp.]RPG35608.1 MAG: DUF1465 family protein [Hyphomicrobiaceae bacterium TMED74]